MKVLWKEVTTSRPQENSTLREKTTAFLQIRFVRRSLVEKGYALVGLGALVGGLLFPCCLDFFFDGMGMASFLVAAATAPATVTYYYPLLASWREESFGSHET